jgi:hypothetical protein
MNNQYISRYAKNDTHFKRVDPFKFASFAEEEKTSPLWIIAGITGLCLVLLTACGLV